jgi:16S rRNA (adenine1518-N6/adenine1519-N6)-dimethyltransferase
MKLSEISETLRQIRVSPVKSLGQNFLHDQNLAHWIVDQATIAPEDFVVEIGPGLGALTERLVEKGAQILALEKDARLANFLRQRLPSPNLEVRNADALDFDVETLFVKPRVKLLGNLPYKISSPLLFKFLKFPSPISFSLFMLQKEVAARLSASPSTRDYGALTLLMQLHYRVEYLRGIPPSVFLPQPNVESAVVRVTPRDPLELPERDNELFAKLVRLGFSQRRKQLQKLIRPAVPQWERAAATLGFDPKARAEDLSLRQWIGLANLAAPGAFSEGTLLQQERFPVVDEADRILRYAYRAEVHANNFRHRAVHIFIFNEAGQIYLQKRGRWKDRHPLLWDSSAGGHVAAGEGYDDTARRELHEELGLTLPLEKIAKIPASDRTGYEFIWLYFGRLAVEREPRPNRSEIEAGAFVAPEIINGWAMARPNDFASGFLECWKAYQELGKATAHERCA